MIYARSEAHLGDVFEGLCDRLPTHTTTGKTDAGTWRYVTREQWNDFNTEKDWKQKMAEKEEKLRETVASETVTVSDTKATTSDEILVDSALPAAEVETSVDNPAVPDELPPPKTGLTKVFKFDEMTKKLKAACERLVEKIEDDVVAYVVGNEEEELGLPIRICHKLTTSCSTDSKKKKKSKKALKSKKEAKSSGAARVLKAEL
jgi:hypothetical protein